MFLATSIILVVIVPLLLFWIRWRQRKLSMFQRNGIPGPKPNFFTGNMQEFHKKRQKCFEEWTEKYGKIFGFFLGAKPYLICTDVECLKIVQIKEFKSFANRDVILPDAGVPNLLVYKSLLLQKDEDWKNMRDIISTCFSSKKIRMMSTLMLHPVNVFLKKIHRIQEPFDITKLYKKLTFDIICRSVFGFASNVQEEETSKFVQSLFSILEVDSADILALISICFPEFEPIPTHLRLIVDNIKSMVDYPSTRYVYEFCKKMVRSRRKSEHQSSDLLQTMMDAEDDSTGEVQKLTNDSVVANIVLFMLAGYDSTSTTLGWCTHYLSRHMDVQEKVRQEINDNIPSNKEIQYNDLSSLTYTDQVISETLRLCPLAVTVVNRICSKDVKYKDFTIPKGAIVVAPVSSLQKDPHYWKEPEKFDPDRFSTKNGNHVDTFQYQPFGTGPRFCPGKRVAQTIMKLTLANLIRSFKLEPANDEEVEVDHTLFVPHAKNGILIRTIPI